MLFHELLEIWYTRKGWKPFRFQQELAASIEAGQHGILNAPTGSGKTYAMFLPALCVAMERKK
jgi:ATP-dependent Lhr-like helicase